MKMYNLILFLVLICRVFAEEQLPTFTEYFNRNYEAYDVKNIKDSGWVIRNSGGAVSIVSENGEELLKFYVESNLRIHDIVVNKSRKKALVLFAEEKSEGLKYKKITFVDQDQKIKNLPAVVGEEMFISSLGSISESGRYAICEFGHKIKVNKNFKVLYKWEIIDLYISCQIVSHGIDSWCDFQKK